MFNPETPPELAVSGWVNAREPLSLAALKGRVVVLVAFQMLCPGCVEHALPQAKRLRARFKPSQVAVIGLHSVFEHHHAMTPAALEVFVSEYKLPFPVAIDLADGTNPPQTMSAYQMQGTPTLLLFDRAGRLRRHYFGRPDDMLLASEIMALAIEDKDSARAEAAAIERKLAATLTAERDEDEHEHDHHGHDHAHGDACGCGHDHHGDHHHGHNHDHSHHHDHSHDHVPGHAGEHSHGLPADAVIPSRFAEAERMTEPPRDLKPGNDS